MEKPRPKLDAELEALFPPIDEDTYEKLKEDIARNGIIYPIVVAEDGTIVSGYNRYKIARELGIEPPIEVRHFESREEMILFAVRDNLLRRHLNTYQKALIGLKLMELEREAAARRRGTRTDLMDETSVKNFTEVAGRAADKAAQAVGVSATTLYKVRRIENEASPQIRELARRGEISIDEALIYARARKRLKPEAIEKVRKAPKRLKRRVKPLKLEDRWIIEVDIPEEWSDIDEVEVTIKPLGLEEEVERVLEEVEMEIVDEEFDAEIESMLSEYEKAIIYLDAVVATIPDEEKRRKAFELIKKRLDEVKLKGRDRVKIGMEGWTVKAYFKLASGEELRRRIREALEDLGVHVEMKDEFIR